ncbi:MAG: Hsp20/alpha crystallin family protein [Herpetosiphonaceae bacterium]|nr:Hsp20/alpha crystallin family protein [Herpetosiphonaceae bacterium]
MAMNRYTPFGDLLSFRDAVNSMFEDGVSTNNGRSQALAMPLDVSETSNGFVVEVALPGVKPEDIDITLQDNVLTISGEVHQSQQANEKPNYHRVERRYGRFARSISLPTQIDSNAVKANLENGVLRLELPKAEAVKPRKISVNGAQNNIESKPVEVNNEQSKERTA